MTLWTIMKAPLILGNDIPSMDPATKSVLSNVEAIAINQDSWGIQAHRVAVQPPRNATLTPSPFDNIAVIAKCSPSEPTQQWAFVNSSNGKKDGLYLEACNPGDPFQQWAATADGSLRNAGAAACIDASGRSDPGQVLPCVPGSPPQQWAFLPATGQVRHGSGMCLDVFNFAGPDVFFGGCKAPADPSISNQQFAPPDAAGLIRSRDAGAPPNSCLAVSGGPPGGQLQTTDAGGATWCLANRNGAEGTWGGVACSSRARGANFLPARGANGLYDIGKSGWNNQAGASGPWPHTRYISGGYSWAGNSFAWRADFSKASTSIAASDETGILDDDLVGGVTHGGTFCLQLATAGMLEVWAGGLSGGRIAVALFNRSPGDDVVEVKWAEVGLAQGTAVRVRDIWGGAELGTFSADFARPVAAHATVYLVLSPV